MARPQSVALGGYFPTPKHLLPEIARLVSIPKTANRESMVSLLDPCAGEGDALFTLQGLWLPNRDHVSFHSYAIEIEKKRHAALLENASLHHNKPNLLHGDAFCAKWTVTESAKGVSALYLNPPYDIDDKHGRLEERFLSRFVSILMEGGTLFFVVPHYALEASATTLATHFSQLECFRFPDEDFTNFKQVVLVGRKSEGLLVDSGLASASPSLVSLVNRWAKEPHLLPVLGEGVTPLWSLSVAPFHWQGAFSSWRMLPVDIDLVLSSLKPWHTADKSGREVPIPNILPTPDGDFLKREYPMAMPPRPAHIAAGIAAGVFNGARVVPNETTNGMPDLLVKGAFDKEFRTIEEKTNKGGAVTGLIQIQQPKLKVTVLDLNRFSYHTLKQEATPTQATQISEMSTGDLLSYYGRSLLDTLLAHCPVLHDPANPEHILPLPITIRGEDAPLGPGTIIPRTLFKAQAHTTMAAIKLLGGLTAKPNERRGKAALVLGEIGSGKSTVAMATAHSIGADRILILCPPHLLESWENQIKATVPWAKASILKTVSDVEAFVRPEAITESDLDFPWSDHKPPTVRIAILSRETAKLGHSLVGVTKACPGCGAPLPTGDLAKRRSRCEHQYHIPKTIFAKMALELAYIVAKRHPGDHRVQGIIQSRMMMRALTKWEKNTDQKTLEALEVATRKDPRLKTIVRQLVQTITLDDITHVDSLERLLAGMNDTALTEEVINLLWNLSSADSTYYGKGESLRKHVARLVCLLPPGSVTQNRVFEKLKANPIEKNEGSHLSGHLDSLNKKLVELRGEQMLHWLHDFSTIKRTDSGVITLHDHPIGSSAHFLAVIAKLAQIEGGWRRTPICGTPLYQSVPEPRRVPLATYITRRHPHFFNFLVVDETQEYSTDGSAQERAAHRLTSLQIPTLCLTGSVMNGYAESLFTNLWALSHAFRAEFSRDERSAFINRYGYKKRILEQMDKEGKVVEYGSVTDRVERSRDIGQAPGVLPLLLLRHLLPISVTLHKTDLALDLPKCREIPVKIPPSPEQESKHTNMVKALLAQIKKDRFSEELSGKLFGQLAEAPSQLDRATDDVGNNPTGSYALRYPESVGGALILDVPAFPASTLLPKEAEMLKTIESELAEGRNVMVFTWHTNLISRLSRLIEERIGEKVAVLDPAKVPTGKRESWIEKEVIGKKRRVMLTNPVAVKTGLNPLVYFATEIFFENPACDPITYRQAVGRVDRIGQTKETRIYSMMYQIKTQVALHELLLLKVAVSLATDGLDAEGALAASGANGANSEYAGLSVGKALYDLLNERNSLSMAA